MPIFSNVRISIALCTFNGEQHIEQLLGSIADQQLQPWELVVCDDGSSDSTLQLVDRFSAKSRFPVRLFKNPRQLGPSANFMRAITLAQGDLIFLADQDDIWLPDKLLCMAPELMSRQAVFCNADVVDSRNDGLGYTLWQHIKFSSEQQQQVSEGCALPVLMKHDVVTGACLGITSQLRDMAGPIPESWMHDAWLGCIAACMGRLGLIQRPLVRYRQHDANAIGAKRIGVLKLLKDGMLQNRGEYLAREHARHLALLERISDLASGAYRQEWRPLTAKIDFLRRRRLWPANRVLRVPRIVRECINGNYQRYSVDWRALAVDALFRD